MANATAEPQQLQAFKVSLDKFQFSAHEGPDGQVHLQPVHLPESDSRPGYDTKPVMASHLMVEAYSKEHAQAEFMKALGITKSEQKFHVRHMGDACEVECVVELGEGKTLKVANAAESAKLAEEARKAREALRRAQESHLDEATKLAHEIQKARAEAATADAKAATATASAEKAQHEANKAQAELEIARAEIEKMRLQAAEKDKASEAEAKAESKPKGKAKK